MKNEHIYRINILVILLILLFGCKEPDIIIDIEPGIYAGGVSCTNNGIFMPGYWQNGIWVSLPIVEPQHQENVIRSIAVTNNKICCAGYRTNSDNIPNPGYWLNGIFKQLPNTGNGTGSVDSVFIANTGEIYASGSVGHSSGNMIPGYWKDNTWYPLPSLSTNESASYAYSIITSGSDVYIGGTTQKTIDTENIFQAVYWKNGVLVKLPVDNELEWSMVKTMIINGNDIYAGGFCGLEPGYWKNSEWISLSLPDLLDAGLVNSMLINGSDIYACGSYVNSSNKRIACYWLNGEIHTLSSLSLDGDSEAKCIVINNGDIYIGGYSMNGLYYDVLHGLLTIPGYWKNDYWITLSSISSIGQAYVNQIVILE